MSLHVVKALSMQQHGCVPASAGDRQEPQQHMDTQSLCGALLCETQTLSLLLAQ